MASARRCSLEYDTSKNHNQPKLLKLPFSPPLHQVIAAPVPHWEPMSFKHLTVPANPPRIASYCAKCNCLIAVGTNENLLAIAEKAHRCAVLPLPRKPATGGIDPQ